MAQALTRLLEAAGEQQKQVDAEVEGEEGEGGALHLVQRWMFNLVKKGVTAANLAVRQVCPGMQPSLCHNSTLAHKRQLSCARCVSDRVLSVVELLQVFVV